MVFLGTHKAAEYDKKGTTPRLARLVHIEKSLVPGNRSEKGRDFSMLPRPSGISLCAGMLIALGTFSLGIEPARAIRAATAENLLPQGDFEGEIHSWTSLWSRQPGSVKAARELTRAYSGRQAVRIEHTGEQDWSFQLGSPLKATPGEIYEFSGALWIQGEGNASFCVILRDIRGEVLSWSHAERQTGQTDGWKLLTSRFLIPPDVATITPRLIGRGKATVWADALSLRRIGKREVLPKEPLPEVACVSGKLAEVEWSPRDGVFRLRDRRSGRTWATRPWGNQIAVLTVRNDRQTIEAQLFHWACELELTLRITVDAQEPEVLLKLEGNGPMPSPIDLPGPWVTVAGQYLILPVNEGISYPVEDPTLPPMDYHLYGGHGLCMAWWGITDLKDGLMAIVETPDDAHVQIPRRENLLTLVPRWISQKGQFGYPRRIRFVLLDHGGYVAMCKRYRRHAEQIGLVKTLAEKRATNPHVDLLIGAVNVWCWDQDPVTLCREMQELGMKRILWSNRARPEQIETLNRMGILTSRYDIYQDVMDPAIFPKLRGVHRDWPTEAWPHDVVVDAAGRWIPGWQVRGRDDQWYPCGVLCDSRALDYARKRILPELSTHPYRCRFIDTTTASPWRECHHPDHPMTRTDSRKWRMELLRFVSEECGLVTGSETGHDAAVPFVHYFEGMLSLGPYRVPDAGRNMLQIWEEVPERVAKFQTGHFYRLPLWELVFHDCVVAQWYWGDYNNKLPALWDRRDLWNALYGTPPMFMFNKQFWQANRERFVRSYRTATPVARATGYVEMVSHRWVTGDHSVQQTEFANGVRVTVNFGDRPYVMEDGYRLEPLTYRFEGLPAAAW
jgi:hypothetical protein